MIPLVDVDVVAWLGSRAGRDAVLRARELSGDSLARSARLRKSGLDAAQAAAVLEQVDLAERARAGGLAALPLLTRDGVEQGTRAVVADRRAALFAAAGAHTVVDLSAGLGFDAASVVAAGMRSIAVERDPLVAALLAHNLGAATVETGDVGTARPHDVGTTSSSTDDVATRIGDAAAATVVVGDGTQVVDSLLAALGPEDVVFVDPARRVAGRRTADGARALPERDPEQWSPPLSWVVALATRHPRIVVKVNPGFAHERVPDGWHAEWVSVDGSPVETTLWSFDAIPSRQVVVVRDGEIHELSARQTRERNAATAPATRNDNAAEEASDAPRVREREHEYDAFAYLLEPDDVFGPSGLVDALADSLDAHEVGDGRWLMSAHPVESTFVRAWRVIDELPTATKALRQALVARGIGNVTVKSRAAGVDAATVRRDLRLTKGAPGTVVLLRDNGAMRAYLVERA